MRSEEIRHRILQIVREAWLREGFAAIVNLDVLGANITASEVEIAREAEYLARRGLLRDLTEQGLAFMPTPEGVDAAPAAETADALAPFYMPRPEDLDGVTELPVRRIFDEHLPIFARLADGQAAPLACLFIDIDKFKSVNDRYGHDKGDMVLSSPW